MPKFITIPEDYNPSNNQCGTLNPISGMDYFATDISVMQVKTVLSESATDVAGLCSSPLINKWAAFKPGSWGGTNDFLNAVFTWIAPTANFTLGDFIGYYHLTPAPIYYADEIPSAIVVEEGDYANIRVRLARGESPPAARSLGATKSQIDVQHTWNNTVTHNRISIPTTGDRSQIVDISFIPDIVATMYIKPYYYVDLGGGDYQDVSAIEAGFKEVAISTVPLQFTGTVTDVTDRTGGNPTSPAIRWHIIRNTTSSKTVYCRIYITGTGINTVDYSLGYLTFSANEDKTGLPFITIESLTGLTTTVTIKVQVDVNSGFTNPLTVAQSSFVWTDPGMPL